MTMAAPSRRTWIMTIRRFAEVAWTRHGPTRYASVATTPILIAFLVPGWWWALCSLGAVIGVIIDLRAQGSFNRLAEQAETLDDEGLAKAVKNHILSLAWITAAYVAPYALLAFAPQPAPVIGIFFCAGAALICATLHVMTRTMIFYTIPVIMLGLMINAFMLAEGVLNAVILTAMAGIMGLNAIVAARGGARSFGDLIGARLKAEEVAEEMERRVEERTAQLAVATKRAQAANKAKSMFLANMSHELRTPLNAVIGYSEIIEEDLESGDTASSAGDLAKIRGSAGHLLTLINEILDLSRIESGKLDLKPGLFDLPALLRGAMDTVKPTASKNRTTCQVTIAPGLSAMTSDETRVRQCVLNLLSNAAKFTHDGVIALDVRSCRIGRARGVAIAVKDTGPGISAEQQARLFQPFMQIDNTKTRAHDGAGLGLVITRRLARAMGGDVQVSSKLGHGATFTLYLPLDMTAAAPAAA
ncbi:MAG: HAMP domain-containing sensor histidine kinase [Hyphomonadaceae bacterium]